MEKNQDYKNRALASLEGKWSKAVVASFIVLAILGAAGGVLDYLLFESASSFWALVMLPLLWGFVVYFLRLIRNEDIGYGRLFDGFKDYLRIFLALFLFELSVGLASILLIVPGIIVSLMFAQTSFIMADDKQISAIDAMKKSKAMMDGHKMELFWLGLSFVGWIILCILTLGVGLLFLFPYMYSAFAHFYEDLKAEQGE